MSERWLQTWLEGLSLAEYKDTLHSHGYTSPEGLASILDRDQLKGMGVTKMGHLTRLFRAIQKLRTDGVEGGSAEDSPVPSLSNSVQPPPLESNGNNGMMVCLYLIACYAL